MTAFILKGAVFSALLIHASATDIKRREINNSVCVAILIVSLYGSGGSFWGAVISSLPFLIPALIKSGSIGGGDIKLTFACGAVLGIWGGLLQTILALSLAVLFSITILLRHGFTVYKKTSIPLAPFLGAGGILSFLIQYIGGIPF